MLFSAKFNKIKNKKTRKSAVGLLKKLIIISKKFQYLFATCAVNGVPSDNFDAISMSFFEKKSNDT